MEETKEKYGIIYLIRNTINDKVYIGQTIDTFDRRYKHNLKDYTHNEHLKSSIEKYGIENFYIDKEFDVAYTKKELDKLEDMYIKIYNSNDSRYGYNFKNGGANGKHSDVTKEKISNSIKGENNPMYGKHHSEKSKIRMSENRKGGTCWMKGKTHSDESKNKLSMSHKNNPKVKENLDKIAKSRMREVMCITTKKKFNSLKEASEFYKCDKNNLSKCCQGKVKSCGKLEDGTPLQWLYYEDYIKLQEEK